MSNIRCYMEEEKLRFNIFYKTVNWVSSKKFHTTNSFSQNITFEFTKKRCIFRIMYTWISCTKGLSFWEYFNLCLFSVAIQNVMKTNKNYGFFFILPRSINSCTKEYECTLRWEMNYMDNTLFKCFAWIDGSIFQELY